MLKAFDCYRETHGNLRVFAEDPAAARKEYDRLYGLVPAASAYPFHVTEVDPRTTPPVEGPGWTDRRKILGTMGTERKLTDPAIEEAPVTPDPVESPPEPAPAVEAPVAPPVAPPPAESATSVPPPAPSSTKSKK